MKKLPYRTVYIDRVGGRSIRMLVDPLLEAHVVIDAWGRRLLPFRWLSLHALRPGPHVHKPLQLQ